MFLPRQAKYVRPYSNGQKNDFRDAEAIAEAVQRPTMKLPWIEAAKKRLLHHNVLAIALVNKLARIAWSVLARGRSFEASTLQAA